MGLILLSSMVFSCTVLQYRRTDTEIYTKFEEKKVPTEIIYHHIDSLELNVRIQKVNATNADETTNLLFIHGSPSSLTAWQSYMWNDSLRAQAHLFAVDRPGYGYSGFGDAIPSINAQAEIISDALERLKLKNIVTVGTSYGGAIAARIAVLNPEIKGVVVVSAALDPEQEKDIWASRLTQWWLTRWLVPTGYRVAGNEKTIHAEELSLIEKDWEKLGIPVLHIHGDIDDIVPVGNIDYSNKIFKNLETKIYPNIDHDLAWKYPEKIIPELLEFLNKL